MILMRTLTILALAKIIVMINLNKLKIQKIQKVFLIWYLIFQKHLLMIIISNKNKLWFSKKINKSTLKRLMIVYYKIKMKFLKKKEVCELSLQPNLLVFRFITRRIVLLQLIWINFFESIFFINLVHYMILKSFIWTLTSQFENWL